MATAKWDIHTKPQTNMIQNKLVQIGDSIWYSTDYNVGRKGMVQHCLKTNEIMQIIKYPPDINPLRHSVCSYQNMIYIIDGCAGLIIEFNPTTKEFIKKTDIDVVGQYPSVIVIDDNIHIFNGTWNNKGIVLIYCPLDNTIHKIKDKFATEKVGNASLLNYKNQLIRFGGHNKSTYSRLDEFLWGVNTVEIVNGYLHLKCHQPLWS